ncbi:MAG: phasin family protein [Solirubrobacterales bacterium]
MAKKDEKGMGDGGVARAAQEGAAQAGQMAERGMSGMMDFGRNQSDQLRALMGASSRAVREMSDVSRDDMDVIMQTGARLAKGMQDVGWELMQYTQRSLRMSMRTANDMMACRSVEDMMQLQRDFVRDSVDTFLQESAKVLELTSSVASEAVHPLQERAGQ